MGAAVGDVSLAGTRDAPVRSAIRDAPVGGQAVLEGVMMRGVAYWAVAVRMPEGEVSLRTFELDGGGRRSLLHRIPVVRGVIALGSSLKIGMQALAIAANAQLATGQGEEQSDELSGAAWTAMIAASIVFAIGLFFVVPVSLTSLIRGQLSSSWLFWVVEGVLRTAIFLGYMWLLSRIRDLRRVFQYHGAEHKVISCYEAGDELVPERAALYPRLHPRCGTSFLLLVMIVAIFVFAPLGLPAWWVLVLTRILGVPVIAGISFELIRLAGRGRRHRWVQVLMYPGLQLQRLTTQEPELDQLAVAISALKAVLEGDECQGGDAHGCGTRL